MGWGSSSVAGDLFALIMGLIKFVEVAACDEYLF